MGHASALAETPVKGSATVELGDEEEVLDADGDVEGSDGGAAGSGSGSGGSKGRRVIGGRVRGFKGSGAAVASLAASALDVATGRLPSALEAIDVVLRVPLFHDVASAASASANGGGARSAGGGSGGGGAGGKAEPKVKGGPKAGGLGGGGDGGGDGGGGGGGGSGGGGGGGGGGTYVGKGKAAGARRLFAEGSASQTPLNGSKASNHNNNGGGSGGGGGSGSVGGGGKLSAALRRASDLSHAEASLCVEDSLSVGADSCVTVNAVSFRWDAFCRGLVSLAHYGVFHLTWFLVLLSGLLFLCSHVAF